MYFHHLLSVLFLVLMSYYNVSHQLMTIDHRYVLLVVSASRSIPRSWLITGCVTRVTIRMSLLETELVTQAERLSSSSCFNGSCCSIFSFSCRVLYIVVCHVGHLFVLPITASDYTFDIFKLFLCIDNFCAPSYMLGSVFYICMTTSFH